MEKIAVSVIVAVYNRESFLDRCIDSLVYQTLDNIEVVLVDDYSQDRSWEIMEQWKTRFPEKIQLLKSEQKGVSYAKNTGLKAAQGQYVTIVDSDDYIDYRMLERLYNCAEENGFPELIHSPIWSVAGSRKWKRAAMSQHETIEDYLNLDAYFLPGKLFRRDLFERFGYLPHYRIGEDVSWAFPVISRLSSIAYSGTPGYFYEFSPNSISINNTDPEIVEDIIRGSERIVQETAAEYREQAILYAYRRIVSLAKNKIAYADRINQYLLQHADVLAEIEDLETKLPAVHEKMASLLVSQETIPQTVFVNGFGKQDNTEQINNCANVFFVEPVVVVLNETNCDVSASPAVVLDAYRNGNFEFVGKYFAIKVCYEQGGIYIDGDVVVDNPFNVLLNDPAFFGFESDEAFTDKVFGCRPGNPCVGRILQTYELDDLYDDPFAPLSDRIRTVLVGMGNVQMISGGLRKPQYGFCLYPVDMFVYTLPCAENVHVCHYKPQALAKGECVTLPVSVLKSLLERQVRNAVAGANSETRKQQRRYEQEKRRSNKRSAYIAKMEEQRAYMENSASWKITKPLRMIKKILGKG